MAKEKRNTKEFEKCRPMQKTKCKSNCGCGEAFYFLGFIGAVVYYVYTASGFWNVILGVLKALIWPAFLVFEALKFLSM